MRQSSHAKESRDGRRAESFAELVCSFANDLEIAANGVHNETALDPWTVAVLRVFEDARKPSRALLERIAGDESHRLRLALEERRLHIGALTGVRVVQRDDRHEPLELLLEIHGDL